MASPPFRKYDATAEIQKEYCHAGHTERDGDAHVIRPVRIGYAEGSESIGGSDHKRLIGGRKLISVIKSVRSTISLLIPRPHSTISNVSFTGLSLVTER